MIRNAELKLAIGATLAALSVAAAGSQPIAQAPLFLSQAVKPLAMLNLSLDHQLFFEAYPDYADLTGNGKAENGYNHDIDYYGYFDSHKCYSYGSGMFSPASDAVNKYCSGNWSGNFLNWATMSRIDVVRKILFGGMRSTDTAAQTVLERSYLPNDAHAFVRYYDGADLNQLTPFSSPSVHTTSSSDSRSVPTPHKTADSARRTFQVASLGTPVVQIGDQVSIRSGALSHVWMRGVVINVSGMQITVQVTAAGGVGSTRNDWQITNHSRAGVTFCNTTVASTGYSQSITAPPLLMAAQGNYALWTANERWQCRWREDRGYTGHSQMTIGNRQFSNGNDMAATGLPSNAENPARDVVRLGGQDFIVRVEACVEGLIGTERCEQYPGGNWKPVGLLQRFAETIDFGLMTGSYVRNLSGGVLRRNIGYIGNEVNPSNGVFIVPATGGNIIDNLSRLRVFGYNHASGTGHYNDAAPNGDNCTWGLRDPVEGRCTNWGNPQSELLLESLRYFAGASSPNFGFSGSDRISGLTQPAWQDPLNEANYCAPLNVLAFNSSVASHDGDQLAGASDLPGLGSVSSWTDGIGQAEAIHGNQWFVGEAGTETNQLCSAKTINSLSGVAGLCPEGPRLRGTYHIAGLAHYAWTKDIRPSLPTSQNVKTFGVTLAPAVPRIDIPRPGQTETAVTILPACRNTQATPHANCAIVDFRIVHQDVANGTGRFFIQWEDSEQGGDYDMDMNGILDYAFTDANTLVVTTNVFAQSTDQRLGFGYVISGTNNDGFHVHSGINNFTMGTCNNCRFDDSPTSRTFTLGASSAGQLELPLWYAAKYGGFDKDKGIGDPQSWDAKNDGKPDNYYYAVDPAQLASDLEEVFLQFEKTNATAAALAVNSTRLTESTRVYQARFDSENWTGEFFAYAIGMDGNIQQPAIWEASNVLPGHSDRNILTIDPDATNAPGRVFRWIGIPGDTTGVTSAQKTSLGSADVLNYLRGDRSLEKLHEADDELDGDGNDVRPFRYRKSLLGDIVNSDPAFLGRGDFGFSALPATQGATYADFVAAKSARPQVLFVGANDGMLHAFNETDGVELFAYVPNAVYPHLANLANPDYTHRYYVDGSPRVVDAYFHGSWKSVLIGATGAGGRSVFALDVTAPHTMGPENVLWEFTHAKMGHTVGQPTIARLADGDFYAIIPNGYNSATGNAVLFLRNLNKNVGDSGLVIEIDTGVGSVAVPNGLSTAFPFDSNGDRIVDVIYAGDLYGNLWKFDVSGSNSSQWTNSNRREVLFEARDADGNVQPITARPEVGRVNGEEMVFFGTGSFVFANDNVVASGDTRQSFYGVIVDRRPNNRPLRRADLVEQEIIWEDYVEEFQRNLRVVSDNPFNSASDNGWFLDLVSPNKGFEGERVVSQAILRADRIIFTTLIPSNDPCTFGGTSWIMEMNAGSGARLDYAVFDLNDDRLFNEGDMVEIEVDGQILLVPVSGIQSEIGIIPRPQILDAGEEEYKCAAGTTGEVECIRELAADPGGRMSWRELR